MSLCSCTMQIVRLVSAAIISAVPCFVAGSEDQGCILMSKYIHNITQCLVLEKSPKKVAPSKLRKNIFLSYQKWHVTMQKGFLYSFVFWTIEKNIYAAIPVQ